MSSRYRKALGVVLLLLALFVSETIESKAAVPPPPPEQPHTDTFTGSYGNLQDYNAVSQRVKVSRAFTYNVLTRTGCDQGSVLSDLDVLASDAFFKYDGLLMVRTSNIGDVTVIVSCGNEQINRCGGTNIFCVQGKPYSGEFDHPTSFISDVLNIYPVLTRRSILNHEILGHAVATWNEQYCTGTETTGYCKAQGLFGSSQLESVMNTGPLSRHDIATWETGAWSRTMYVLKQYVDITCTTLGYDPCTGRFYQADGWSWYPVDGGWYNPQGNYEYGPCNSDGYRYAPMQSKWKVPGLGDGYDTRYNQWTVVPVC